MTDSDWAGAEPDRVAGETSHTTTYQYDDGDFENYEDPASNPFAPFETEVAQQFHLSRSGRLVSVTVCFYRPSTDPHRDVVFDLRLYADDDGEPGRSRGLTYTWESQIRGPGDDRCLTFSGAMAGTSLAPGEHWIGIRWQANSNKVLGEDVYAPTDTPPRDSQGNIEYETEVRMRARATSTADWPATFTDPRSTGERIKAYGIRLVVDDSTPTPPPDPTPGPGPDPGPAPESACDGGTCLLEDDRFRVRTRYAMAGMSSQSGGTIAAGLAGAAGLFTFGGDAPELMVRMVDDCSGSGYWMLYAGAATDADYAIAVRDTTTNELKWFRARGGASIRDMAFACGKLGSQARHGTGGPARCGPASLPASPAAPAFRPAPVRPPCRGEERRSGTPRAELLPRRRPFTNTEGGSSWCTGCWIAVLPSFSPPCLQRPRLR